MKSLTPILLITLSLGLFYLHVSPRYQSIQTLMTEEVQYKNALAKAGELQDRRDQLLTKYNGFSKSDSDRVKRLIPDTVNTVKLVADMNSIAGKYGITIKSIVTTQQKVDDSQAVGGKGTAAPKKPYQTTLITFAFTSTYQNLVQYLKDLEKSLQLIDDSGRGVTLKVEEFLPDETVLITCEIIGQNILGEVF